MSGFPLFVRTLQLSSLYAGVSASEVEEHLSVGMTLLAKGQYSDALSHFHAAIDADPANYMSYYKRATVFLALSRSRPALADLDKVLQLKSDFIQVCEYIKKMISLYNLSQPTQSTTLGVSSMYIHTNTILISSTYFQN